MTLLWILQTTAVVLLLWTAVEAIRRLYFHPIAHILGPRLAALTWWYEFYYDATQPGQYVFKIQELHKRYGTSESAPCSIQAPTLFRPHHRESLPTRSISTTSAFWTLSTRLQWSEGTSTTISCGVFASPVEWAPPPAITCTDCDGNPSPISSARRTFCIWKG